MALDVRMVSSLPELEALREAWHALLERAGNTEVFALPEWHLAWWETMGIGRQMAILTVTDGDGLVGVLPLAAYRGGPRDAYARVVEFSGGTQADVHDLLVQPGCSQDVLAAMEGPFTALRRKADLLRLSGVLEASPLLSWPAIAASEHAREVQQLPAATIGSTFDEMARRWHKSHRTDVRRQQRRLTEQGQLSLDCIADADAAKEVLDPLLATHTAPWGARGHRLAKRNAALRRFFSRLIDRMWEHGWVHVSVLRLDDVPISYNFGFLYRGRFYWYKPAFAQAYAPYSPGKVHVAKLLELGVDEGWHTFDLLTGAEPYKFAWADDERRTVTSTAYGTSVVAKTAKWLSAYRRPGALRTLRAARRLVAR